MIVLATTLVLAGMLASLVVASVLLKIRRSREIKPRECICRHWNNVHSDKGTGRCCISYGVSEKFPKGSRCACTVFIPKPNSPPPSDKSYQELERMVGL